MDRQLGDWLEGYLDYTKNSEPPRSYHVWIGLTALAAALQRKVYTSWYMGKLFPNLFVILVGPSGKCRKGTAMAFGIDMLKQVSRITLCAQKVTEQQFIRDLKLSHQAYRDPTAGTANHQSAMTIMSQELAVFLGTGNIDLLATLTDIYDSLDEWEYKTKTAGKDRIRGVCLNFLGGTAPDWIDTMIPHTARGGGFTSRVIFVVERDKDKIIVDPTPTPRMRKLRTQLIHDFQKIATLAGEMKMDDQAHEVYRDWYIDQTNNPPFAHARFDGYCARRATHVWKLSMILSASRGNDMIIRIEDFERAVRILESAETTMPLAYSGLSRTMYAEVTETVLHYISGKGRIRYSAILRKFFPEIDTYSLDIALTTLLNMRAIQEIKTVGSDRIFRLREEEKCQSKEADE